MSQVSAIIADLAAFTEREIIGLTLEIDATLRENTPRDTGFARANWVPSVGTPSPSVEPLLRRPSPGQVAEAAAAAAAGQQGILNYRLSEGSVFVTNGVVYIQKLNDGWSQQAPAAFVEASVVQAVAARSRS